MPDGEPDSHAMAPAHAIAGTKLTALSKGRVVLCELNWSNKSAFLLVTRGRTAGGLCLFRCVEYVEILWNPGAVPASDQPPRGKKSLYGRVASNGRGPQFQPYDHEDGLLFSAKSSRESMMDW